MNFQRIRRIKAAVTALAFMATLIMAGQVLAAKTPPMSIINVNTASVEQLMELPGIGKSKADAIVAYRTQSKFAKKDDLLNVRGIGEKLLAKISDHVAVTGGGKKAGTAGKATR